MVEIAADGPHDDYPRIQSDADLDHGRMRAPHLVRILLHGLLHPKRRITSPHRVILVGQWGARQP
jgi:hypothetical protein